MTTQEFLALPARERDALVVEHVMGMQYWGSCCWGPDRTHITKLSYTTDIATAWTIVEKLPYRFTLNKVDMPDRWLVQITRHNGMGDFTEWRSETTHAPMAICIAALKSVDILDGL